MDSGQPTPTFPSVTIPATTDRLFPGPAEIESHENRRKGNAISPTYGKVADVSDGASLAGEDRMMPERIERDRRSKKGQRDRTGCPKTPRVIRRPLLLTISSCGIQSARAK